MADVSNVRHLPRSLLPVSIVAVRPAWPDTYRVLLYFYKYVCEFGCTPFQDHIVCGVGLVSFSKFQLAPAVCARKIIDSR